MNFKTHSLLFEIDIMCSYLCSGMKLRDAERWFLGKAEKEMSRMRMLYIDYAREKRLSEL